VDGLVDLFPARAPRKRSASRSDLGKVGIAGRRHCRPHRTLPRPDLGRDLADDFGGVTGARTEGRFNPLSIAVTAPYATVRATSRAPGPDDECAEETRMTVLTRARRITGLTHRLRLRTNPARSPRPLKIGTIGAVLIAVVLSLGFATPANAATGNYASFSCHYQTGTDYWCNPYIEPGHVVLGYVGLYNGNGHDYTLSFENHYAGAYHMVIRVLADNGTVWDYPESSDGHRIYYGIQRIWIWIQGYGLSPALTVK
jgi:hypothetical protein